MSSSREKGCFDIGNATRVALSIWGGELVRLEQEGKAETSSLGKARNEGLHRGEQQQHHIVGTQPNEKDGNERGAVTAATAEAQAEEVELLQRAQNKINKSLNHKIQCGNGSLMRCAPIAIVFHDAEAATLMDLAHRASEVTHPYMTNGEACGMYCLLLKSTMHDTSKEDLARIVGEYAWQSESLKTRFERYHRKSTPIEENSGGDREEETYLATWSTVPETEISSSGYVVHTLEAALWSFFTTESFEDGAVKAVNLGNDADTVGAVYGGLAGAYYGLEGVPERWLAGLQRKELVEEVTERVVRLVCGG